MTLPWGTVKLNLRYPGQYFDDESNLHYNGFRTYDSRTGRYTQGDPIGLNGGWNRFGYVGANQLSWIDSVGLQAGSMGFPNIEGEFNQYKNALIDAYTQTLFFAATDGLLGVAVEAVRPRTGEQVPICERCQSTFSDTQFPSGTMFKK